MSEQIKLTLRAVTITRLRAAAAELETSIGDVVDQAVHQGLRDVTNGRAAILEAKVLALRNFKIPEVNEVGKAAPQTNGHAAKPKVVAAKPVAKPAVVKPVAPKPVAKPAAKPAAPRAVTPVRSGRPGRPKGSKNKPKTEEAAPVVAPLGDVPTV